MCNRYTPARGNEPIFDLFGRVTVNYPPGSWRKIGPWGAGPFIRRAATGGFEVIVGQWGMIRPGSPVRKAATQDGRPRLTNNARSETIAKLPTYRHAWNRGQRCIIPLESYDEPNWELGKNVWWEFRRADGAPWGVAGLWSEWTDSETGEVVPSYTMLTANADEHELMSRMHRPDPKRAPDQQDKRSIVPLDPGDWLMWLNGTNEEAWQVLQVPAVEVFNAGPEQRVAGERLL